MIWCVAFRLLRKPWSWDNRCTTSGGHGCIGCRPAWWILLKWMWLLNHLQAGNSPGQRFLMKLRYLTILVALGGIGGEFHDIESAEYSESRFGHIPCWYAIPTVPPSTFGVGVRMYMAKYSWAALLKILLVPPLITKHFYLEGFGEAMSDCRGRPNGPSADPGSCQTFFLW
jgi:hypothetical protein